MPESCRILIIGGGVTGLCAAHYAIKAFGRDAVLLVEASERVGGHTRTERMDGFALDRGPNGFLDREPLTLKWMEDIGLGGKLIRANEKAARRFLLKNGQLTEILPPPRFLLTPLLSIHGRARLLCEPFIPKRTDPAPESIWDFAARRIGREAADTLVSSMVTGVFGGDAKKLSLGHCFPRMAAMEREYGCLFKALKAKRREDPNVSAAGPGGTLTSAVNGVETIVETAETGLKEQIWTNSKVSSIEKRGDSYYIQRENDTPIEARAVVLAAPAYAASRMLAPLDGGLAKTLDRIDYANIVVVCTAYPRERVGHDMDGFGFLVPRSEKRRILGCIWTSSIFPPQAPDGMVLLRTMIGGYNDPGAVDLSDGELLDYVKREVEPLLSIQGEPALVRIYRHRRGIPQYLLHHGEVLAATEAAEAQYPGLIFAGNAYRGVGLNDCVISAHRAVEKLTG